MRLGEIVLRQFLRIDHTSGKRMFFSYMTTSNPQFLDSKFALKKWNRNWNRSSNVSIEIKSRYRNRNQSYKKAETESDLVSKSEPVLKSKFDFILKLNVKLTSNFWAIWKLTSKCLLNISEWFTFQENSNAEACA